MTTRTVAVNPRSSVRPSTNRFGYWTSVLTVVVTVVSFASAIFTPPISGPFCQSGCIAYPYTDVVSQVPRDYLWMYPALLLAPLFVVLMACIHRFAPDDSKLFGLLGLSFSVVFAVLISIDYYIQLTVIQPSLLKGETDGLILFTQYNPHGIFIAVEELAYLMMSLSFLFAAGVFNRPEHVETLVRWLFVACFVLTIGALIVLSVLYGQDREYRFEVAAITINWTTLIISGVLLSNIFRRSSNS